MHPEILEYDNHTQIYYRNRDDETQRILVLDKDGKTIQDEICEYIDGKHIANVVFGADHVTIIGKREYTDDGYQDYRKVGDELVLVRTMQDKWLTVGEKAKSSFYNAQGELVFYILIEKDPDPNIGMVSMGNFDKNGCEFSWDSPPDDARNLQTYSDY